MQTVALFALLMPTLTVASAPVVQQEPPLQIWLSSNDHLKFGEEIRVYVRTEEDGHLMVLHADPEGRVRVLFPLDPFTDDFIRGGRDFELRDRENDDAIRTVEEVGYGTVYVAFSTDPFRYSEFSRGDHWDYRVFDEYEITGDAEGPLTQIAQRMASSSSFVYDTDTYYLSPPSAYTNAYRNYRPGYSGRHDHHDIGVRIGLHIGGPRYSGWPLHRYRYGYGAGYWYDPFYYDPFYYDPFYYAPYWDPFFFGFGYGYGYRHGYGYGYGGYYGANYYYGRNAFYGGSGVRVNRRYTTRNSQPVVASNYRDRRLGPSGTLASASRRASSTRARPVRASTAVSRRTPTTRAATPGTTRRTPTTRAATPGTTRRTADRGATPVTPSNRRAAPQRSPTAGSNGRRATGERIYRVGPRVSTTTPTSRAQRSTRPAPQQRATAPSSRRGTASRARATSSSGSRATPTRSSGSRSQARPFSSGGRRAAPQRSTSSTRSRTSARRSTSRSSPGSRVQRSSPRRTTRSAPRRSSSGRSATRSSGSSSRGRSSARRSSGSRGSSSPARRSGRRRN